jgi:Zn-finger nucleic acid-binding protein
MDYCRICKGVWLDMGEIEAIRTENWVFLAGKFLKWLV